MADLSYVLRDRRRRADPQCAECHGDGTVSYTSSNRDGSVDEACVCVSREDVPDPLADEGNSDARELASDRY